MGIFVILALTATVCLIPVRATINCESRVERANAYEQCFNDQGLEAPDVFESYRTSNSNDLDNLHLQDLYLRYGDSFCRNHLQLKEAMRCSTDIQLSCMDPTVRHLQPSADEMARTVDPFCDNLENLDFTCIKQRQAPVERCAFIRGTEEGQRITDVSQLICISRLIAAECTKKELKTCGCASSKVYSDTIMDILMPNFCDQTTSRVVCSQTNPKEFVDDGLNGVTRQGLAMSLVALSVLVLAALV